MLNNTLRCVLSLSRIWHVLRCVSWKDVFWTHQGVLLNTPRCVIEHTFRCVIEHTFRCVIQHTFRCDIQHTFRCVIQYTFKYVKYMPLVCNNTPSDVLRSTPCRTHPHKWKYIHSYGNIGYIYLLNRKVILCFTIKGAK